MRALVDQWGTGGNLNFMAPELAGDEKLREWLARLERLSLSPGMLEMLNYWMQDVDWTLDEVQAFLTGTRGTHVSDDRVLATVLFTDIVGSTERAAALGDERWRMLLDEHDAVVRREIERLGAAL